MHNLFLFLKTQVTVLNIVLFLILLAFFCRKYNKRKAFLLFSYGACIFFLLCSTNYLPYTLAKKLEFQYLPFDTAQFPGLAKSRVYIHVLGNDYKLDKGLPANAMLGLGSLARLAEAIRISRLLDSSIIIGSGTGPQGAETQAEVTKRAAIALGADSNRVDMVTTPSNTEEEAKALSKKFGNRVRVIVVTEAVHMPRAMKLFKAEGFNPVAAPTNFKTNKEFNSIGLGWIPTIENMDLMNRVIHEFLASLHAGL